MTEPHFDGVTYDPDADQKRLTTALKAVEAVMQDGQWWSYDRLRAEIRKRYGVECSENGVAARVRDLRKPKFGGYNIEARRTKSKAGERSGLWIYRMVLGQGRFF